MYILIHIGINGVERNELCSRRKSTIEKYLKEKGYYWSNKIGRYINDRTIGIPGGNGSEYVIEKLNVLK